MEDLIEEAGLGHNSFSKETLVDLLVKIESLKEERKSLNADIKLVFDAAQERGYDKKAIKEMLRIRAIDQETFKQQEEIRDMYLVALGLV